MSLADKVSVITGSSKGIGLAIARRLAKEGSNVVVNSRNQASVDNVVEQLKKEFPVEVIGITADVSKENDVKKMFDITIDKFGRVDILVNNAGITKDNLILRMKEEDWQAVLDTNLKSAFWVCKIFLKSMLKSGGRIINISSVVGEIGNPGQTNYSASKGGLIAFTKSLAREVAIKNVTVNTVAPGFIETDMTDKLTEENKKKLFDQIPLRRLGCGEDIAGAVAFLASENASYITGHTLSVNGGLSM